MLTRIQYDALKRMSRGLIPFESPCDLYSDNGRRELERRRSALSELYAFRLIKRTDNGPAVTARGKAWLAKIETGARGDFVTPAALETATGARVGTLDMRTSRLRARLRANV